MLPLFAAVGRAAGDRRGALHLGLGPRLPARLPADARHARAAAAPASRCCARPPRRTIASSPTSSSSWRGRRLSRLRTYRGPAGAHQPAPRGRRPAAAGGAAGVAGRAPAASSGLGDRLHADQARRRAGRGVALGRGIRRVAYSGDRTTDARSRSRSGCCANDVKAVVATSALGHGLRQVRPRASSSTTRRPARSIVLLPAGRPRRPRGRARRRRAVAGRRGPAHPGLLHRAGVPLARAGRARCWPISRLPGRHGRSTRELLAVVNLGMGRLEAMLKILDVEGAVRRDGSRWQAVPDADWTYDGDRYAAGDRAAPSRAGGDGAFGADGRCLMRALQEELDDPDPGTAGVVLSARRRDSPIRRIQRWSSRPAGTCARARSSSRSRRWPPTPTGAMRKIPDGVRIDAGLVAGALW